MFVYEIKHDLNAYLSEWASETPIRTMADVMCAFNAAHADNALRFGQDLFLAADATRVDLSEPEYRSARAMDLRSAAALGLDAYMDAHRLDAVLFAGRTGAANRRAKAGYPERSGAGRLHRRPQRRGHPLFIRSAQHSPPAPGANRPCSVSPTPSSRRPRRAVHRRAMPLDAQPRQPLADHASYRVDPDRPRDRIGQVVRPHEVLYEALKREERQAGCAARASVWERLLRGGAGSVCNDRMDNGEPTRLTASSAVPMSVFDSDVQPVVLGLFLLDQLPHLTGGAQDVSALHPCSEKAVK